MRKVLSILLIVFLLFSYGCTKSNLPEGFENEEFYEDMVKTLGMMLDSTEHQDYGLIEEVADMGKKYSREDMLNEKEKEIFRIYRDTLEALLVYSVTGNHHKRDKDDILNINNPYGLELSKKLIEFRESLE